MSPDRPLSTRWRQRLVPSARRSVPLLLVAGLAAVATACGGDDEGTQPTPSPTMAQTTTAAATAAPTAAATASPTAAATTAGSVAPTAAGTAAPAAGTGDAANGQALAQNGCVGCHQVDADGVGPKWGGLFGSQVQLADGTVVTADEEYLRRSITDPNAEVVDGYFVQMPAVGLSPEEVDDVVAYIVSLGPPA